jgi:hypothetical protein
LSINITSSLYNYYVSSDHRVIRESDLLKFITPAPVKPLSDLLLTIYDNEEDYVNGVLMIIHQIPYQSVPSKYPIEYLVENIGDCELSYLIASIIVNYLPVILVVYDLNETTKHVNIGVALPSPPTNVRTGEPYYFLLNNVKYYVAESTGGNWEQGWRVGEMPRELLGLKFRVYSVEQNQTQPGVITVYFTTALTEPNLTVRILPLIFITKIEGELVLNETYGVNKTISVYFEDYNGKLYLYTQKITDNYGKFATIIMPLSFLHSPLGIYKIKVGWAGDLIYRGVMTEANFLGMSSFLILPLWVLPILIMIGSLLITRRRKENAKAG